MKIYSPLLLASTFLFICITANSQAADSCTGNLTVNAQLPFDTTSFICNSVWSSQGFVLRYRQTDTKQWSFVLSAPNSNVYIAMGFSPDGQMIGSSAVVGWVGTNGVPSMKRYYLGGQSPKDVVADSGNLQLGKSNIVATPAGIFMAFQLNTDMPETKVLYAVGSPNQVPTGNSLRLTEHSDRISTSLNYVTGQTQAQSTPYRKLKRSHGILNLLGWGILMPIGLMVARYMRQWDPIWFYSHAVIQSLGFILGVAGVISGLVLNDRLNTNVKNHKGIGITVLVLGCLQAIAVLARPDKASKIRKYWNWYHHNAGRLLVILAAANVFYGIHLAKGGRSWNAGYALAIVVLFVTSVVLELRMFMKR